MATPPVDTPLPPLDTSIPPVDAPPVDVESAPPVAAATLDGVESLPHAITTPAHRPATTKTKPFPFTASMLFSSRPHRTRPASYTPGYHSGETTVNESGPASAPCSDSLIRAA